MKMAFSPKYMERQSNILKGQDQIYNKAIESEFLKQVGGSEMSLAAKVCEVFNHPTPMKAFLQNYSVCI